MSKLKKAIILIMTLIFTAFMSVYLYAWHRYSSIYKSQGENAQRLEEVNRNPEKYKKVEGITNILLIGADTRVEGEVSHSDAITILTIDSTRDKIKLTSILRDALVDIPGHGQQKITHAYAYGGIELLRQTIEDNFDVRLDKYASIDFEGFKSLIDAVGGLELEVKDDDEVKELNRCMDIELDDNPKLSKDDIPYIDKPGIQKLNGRQTLAFSRMRYVGNGVYDRSRRQREVIEKLLSKMKETSVMKYPSLAESILPYLETNVPFKEALSLAYTVSAMNGFNINKLQVPTDELNEGITVNKKIGWVNVMDLDANKKVLHDFIFDDITYDKTQHKQFTYEGSPEQQKYNPSYSGNNNQNNNDDDDKYKPDKKPVVEQKPSTNTNNNQTKPNTNETKPTTPKPEEPTKPDTKPEPDTKPNPDTKPEPDTKPDENNGNGNDTKPEAGGSGNQTQTE